MNRKLFSIRDIIILALLLSLALIFFIFASKDRGEEVEIWVGGEIREVFPLDTPFDVTLENGVRIVGDGECAYFAHSDCPDKLCINMGELSVSGEWASCLPNETVVKIAKGDEEVDVVT